MAEIEQEMQIRTGLMHKLTWGSVDDDFFFSLIILCFMSALCCLVANVVSYVNFVTFITLGQSHVLYQNTINDLFTFPV